MASCQPATPGELVAQYFESLVIEPEPAELAAAAEEVFPPEQKEPAESWMGPPEDQKQADEESEEDTESEEGSEDGSDQESEETEEPAKDFVRETHDPRRYPVDVITLEALLYSHIVLNCGGQEFHAPVVSSLMLVSIISLTPASFFLGIGVGVPVFWLAQRCLAR
jgi:hypothetical protein